MESGRCLNCPGALLERFGQCFWFPGSSGRVTSARNRRRAVRVLRAAGRGLGLGLGHLRGVIRRRLHGLGRLR